MIPRRALLWLGATFGILAFRPALGDDGEASGVVGAPRTFRVAAAPGAAAAAVASARTGDRIILGPGIHDGSLTLLKPIVLRGEPGAIVDGGGTGSVINVAADGAVVQSLTVQGSGRDVMKEDAAVRVLSAASVRVSRVTARDVLYGVYAERATGLVVASCDLEGRVEPRNETGDGNGIHLWYCTGVELRDNHVQHFLDAIYLSFANQVHVAGNRLEWNGRYGLHSMYCQSNRLDHNVFALNVAGCALMFSNHLDIDHNDFVHNRGSRTYGLLLRDCSAGTFTDNRMADNTVAVFMDNSNRNTFRGNLVEDNGWGLLLFSSCAGNTFAMNSFIQNDYPVALDMRRTSNRFDDGTRGNYWSEAETYDLDGDGVGDTPYGPVTAFAFVSKQYPDLAVLAKSPAVAALGVAERVFPSLRPSEAVDHFPLIHPIAAPTRLGNDAAPARRTTAWGHVLGFSALAGVGAIGVTRGRRR